MKVNGDQKLSSFENDSTYFKQIITENFGFSVQVLVIWIMVFTLTFIV